jgi:hypothetical protein
MRQRTAFADYSATQLASDEAIESEPQLLRCIGLKLARLAVSSIRRAPQLSGGKLPSLGSAHDRV